MKITRFVFLCLLSMLIAWIGVVGFALIASGYTESLIAGNLDQPFDTSVYGKNEERVLQSDQFFSDQKSPGILVLVFTKKEDGKYYSKFSSTLVEAMIGSFSPEMWFQRPVPIQPFFIVPLGIHLAIVLVIRLALRMPQLKVFLCPDLLSHTLKSLVFLVMLAWWSQLARMTWSSERLGAGAYLNDSMSGPIGLSILWISSVFVYLYILYATLNIGRKTEANGRCAGCGYDVVGLKCCPECDLEIGAYIPSKLRINHWYLAAMFIITFFSPVMVASIYSIFG